MTYNHQLIDIQLYVYNVSSCEMLWDAIKARDCDRRLIVDLAMIPIEWVFSMFLARTSNHLHNKLWDQITYHSQTSMTAPSAFGYWWIISSHTLWRMRLLVHGGIIVKPLHWRHNGHDSVSNHQSCYCFLRLFIQTQIKDDIKAPRHWPLCGEFTGDRWIPHTNGQ